MAWPIHESLHRREAISARTKAALAAAKARGVRLGNPHLTPGDTRRATAVRSERALSYARDVAVYITEARKAGCKSLGDLARALTARGIATPAGAEKWDATAVKRVLARIERAKRTDLYIDVQNGAALRSSAA